MKVRTVIKLDGESYYGKVQEAHPDDFEPSIDKMCQLAKDVAYFSMELENGTRLILPRESARRSVWLVETISE